MNVMIGAYPPITAPALTILAAMTQNVAKIDWKDCTESILALLITSAFRRRIPIADGLVLGFITYAVIKGFGGWAREISWLAYLLAIVLVLYFVFVRSRMSQPRFQASSGSGSSDRAGAVAVLAAPRLKGAIRTPMACQK